MIALAAFALGSCIAVGASSDQVLAGDLIAAAPEWSAIPPETPVALAPAPGVKRVFRLPELVRLAQRWNLKAPDREFCVTRPVAAIDPAMVLAAMRHELPEALIEIIECSRQPAPQGDIEFPLSSLHQSSGGAFWGGFVKYAGEHRFVIWARVKIQVTAARVIASDAIPAGRTLDAALLSVESREEFPSPGYLTDVAQAAGKVARRSIAAGTPIRAEWLEAARAVTRGETVQVEVIDGGAHLKLDGVAVTSGAVGDIVQILNPDSKRQFRARVLSPGRVLVSKGNQ